MLAHCRRRKPLGPPAGEPDALGSVRLPVDDLVAALLPCNPWLVVC